MKIAHTRGASIAMGLLMTLLACCGQSSAQPSWVISGKLLGKPAKDGNPDGKPASDVSGLACVPAQAAIDRICLLADDESQGVQIVILQAGAGLAGDFIRLTTSAFEGKPLELDAEAVAFADGAFYVIGSHGRARHEEGAKEEKNIARAKATRVLYEIRFGVGDIDATSGKILRSPAIRSTMRVSPAIQAHPELAPFYDQALEDGGVTVEGLTVRDGKAFIGFRGPVLKEEAVILSIPLDALFGKNDDLGLLLHVPLGRDTFGKARGIRDLVANGHGFIGIAGPVLDPGSEDYVIRAGDYALFRWDGSGTAELHDCPAFPVKTKPEALLPLSLPGADLHALLLFDGPASGAPALVGENCAPPARDVAVP